MIYVDSLFDTTEMKSANWKYNQSCHMTADGHEELMEFAARLGIKPPWLQHPGRHSEHFDLTASKRAQAVRMGAKELTRDEAAHQLIARMDAAKAARKGQAT